MFDDTIIIEPEPCFEDPGLPEAPGDVPTAPGDDLLVPGASTSTAQTDSGAQIFVPDFTHMPPETYAQIQPSAKQMAPSASVEPMPMAPSAFAPQAQAENGATPSKPGLDPKSLLIGAFIGAAGALAYWWFFGGGKENYE
jgi:hypothetical protein